MAEEENRNTFRVASFILGGALVLALIFLVYNYQKGKEVSAYLKDQKAELVSQLDSMKTRYDVVMSDTDSLNDSLKQKREAIEELQKTITGLKTSVKMLRKYRGEVIKLRRENQRLFKLADSLQRSNSVLLVQRDSVQSQLEAQQQRSEQLKKQNLTLAEKVAKGSKVSAENIHAEGIRISRKGRISTTKRARRADKLRVCFTLSKNNLTEPGEKNIYVKIATPDNKLIGGNAADHSFTAAGKPDHFSSKTTVYYEGEPLDVCIFVEQPGNGLVKGKYMVALYDDNGFIGDGSLSLQ